MCGTTRFSIDRILAVAVFCVFLSAGQYVRADVPLDLDPQYTLIITANTAKSPSDISTAYNGRWVFDVSLSADMKTVMFKVVSGPNASKTGIYKDVVYSFPVTGSAGGTYSFSGTSLGTPKKSSFNLGMAGSFNPTSALLTITGNEITSQIQRANGTLVGGIYYFNVKLVPEPSTSVLVLIALGTLGTGLTLKGSLQKLHIPISRKSRSA